MYVVTVRFRIKPEHSQGFMPLMLSNASDSLRNEAGCHRFDVCSDSERPDDLFLYEIYADSSAFDTHLQSPHFREFDEKTQHMIASKEVLTFNQLQL